MNAAETIATLRAELAKLRKERDDYAEEARNEAEYIREISFLLGCADGDDTPKDRIAQLREAVATHDQELRRWQDEIRDAVIRHSGAPDSRIDGAGCDSGDPLDLSLAEISQGFAWIADKHAETVANVTRERDEAKRSSRMYELLRREAFAYRNTAIAERDEARANEREALSDNSGAKEEIRSLLEKLSVVTASRDSLASQLAELRSVYELCVKDAQRMSEQIDKHNDVVSQLDAARTMIRTGAEQAEVAETLAAERETELTAQLDRIKAVSVDPQSLDGLTIEYHGDDNRFYAYKDGQLKWSGDAAYNVWRCVGFQAQLDQLNARVEEKMNEARTYIKEDLAL